MQNVKVLMLRMTKGLSLEEAANLFEIEYDRYVEFEEFGVKLTKEEKNRMEKVIHSWVNPNSN